MHKLLFTIACLFSLFGFSHAQGYGLLFKSTEVGIESRTGLNLTAEDEIQYDGRVTIAFDLSFRNNPIHFGTIFQLKETTSGKTLAFNCNMFEEGREWVFTLDGHPIGLTAPMPAAMKTQYNRWHHIRITLDARSGLLHFSCDSVQQYTATFQLPEQSSFSLVFGVDQQAKQLIPESPYFSLKDISVFDEQDREKYHWSLQESRGEVIKDRIQGKKAIAYNPQWVMQYHQKWQALTQFELETGPQVAFCNQLQKVYFLYTNHFYQYDLVTGQMEKQEFPQAAPIGSEYSQNALCVGNEILVYDHMQPYLSRFNLGTEQWDSVHQVSDVPTAFHHHNKLIHPVTGQLTTIGGYGYFKYTNRIQSYNETNATWQELSFSGDTLSPRYLAGLGRSTEDSTVYYLFGGLGNQEGNQLLGQQQAYDLYRLDFSGASLERQWAIPANGVPRSFTPVNSLVVQSAENYFYTLVFDQQDYHTSLHLLKGAINQPKLTFIGDSIPYYFKDVDSYADLFYWEGGNQFLALTLHNGKNGKAAIGLYTLLFPPVEWIQPTEQSSTAINMLWLGGIGVVVAFLIGLVLLIRKRKVAKREPSVSGVPVEQPVVRAEVCYPDRNRINLFGGFQVLDRQGQDITDRFSPTVKELFLLVFSHSVKGKNGISSNGIHQLIWPDKEEVKAKNNRGVNVGRLRAVLAELDGVSLEYTQAKWCLQYTDALFIDFNRVKEIIGSGLGKTDPQQAIQRALPLIERGRILPCMTKEWLAIFKEQETSMVIEFLEQVIQHPDLQPQQELQINLAEAIFKFDQLNDTALKHYCKNLHQLGKHGVAWEAYQRFASQYEETYNEAYPADFKWLIK